MTTNGNIQKKKKKSPNCDFLIVGALRLRGVSIASFFLVSYKNPDIYLLIPIRIA